MKEEEGRRQKEREKERERERENGEEKTEREDGIRSEVCGSENE